MVKANGKISWNSTCISLPTMAHHDHGLGFVLSGNVWKHNGSFWFRQGPKSALIHTPEVTVVQVQRRGVGEWGWQGNMIFNASIKWYAVLFVRLALPFSLAFWCWILTWEVWYVKTLLKESNKGICLRVIAAPFHVLIGGSWCRHQFLIKKVTINHYYI